MSLDSNEKLEIGDTVRIIPNHACPVINLSDKAYGIRRGKVEAELLIAGRGKVQ
jgi:D-serine deaminase-like pyridoxal phosphate-dependent protein